MFESKLPLSFYKEIAMLNADHEVSIVQHIETRKIYIKKQMNIYHFGVYKQLFFAPIRNTPRIYAMHEADGKLTIVEEYISGETLQEVLDICSSLPEADVIRYSMQLCDILAELHACKPAIIHRDIKPSNLILTEDGRIVLIDMNAARIESPDKSRDTHLLGTEDFAAPEQYGFGASSPKTDIYAVGVLMQTLLSGEPDAELPADCSLKPVIDKCRKIGPESRFASVEQLKKALSQLRSAKGNAKNLR